MKSWGIIIVTAIGFLMGLILAGVGVTSAKTYFSGPTTTDKRPDSYWLEAGLNSSHLTGLISNGKCHTSEKYFLACVNSLLQVLPKYHFSLSTETGLLVKSELASIYDGRSEKANLQPFIKIYEMQKNRILDFDNLWSQILAQASSAESKSLSIGLGINGFLSVYKDPHTYILPGQFFEEVSSKTERSQLFVGLSFERKNGHIKIRKVFKNSDADIAGLKNSDQLLSLNGIEARYLNLSDISATLKNPDVSAFEFRVSRENESIKISVKRSRRILSHVTLEKETGIRNYAVITLSKFTRGICAELTQQIKSLSTDSVSGIVLDLRDNPGGELNEAACLAGLFIGMNKKIYSVKYFDPLKSDEVVLTTGSLLFTGPMVILVNSSSASAAELLSGALQEYRRAVVVGERTFGKGTFQESEAWAKNPKISLFRTQGFYLLPSGTSTQLSGVTPDFQIKEDHQQLREENNYYNPIAAENYAVASDQSQLYKGELEKCSSKSEFDKKDLILKKGLEVLSCHRISAVMAGQYATDDFNQ